jgi:hypothetical protein
MSAYQSFNIAQIRKLSVRQQTYRQSVSNQQLYYRRLQLSINLAIEKSKYESDYESDHEVTERANIWPGKPPHTARAAQQSTAQVMSGSTAAAGLQSQDCKRLSTYYKMKSMFMIIFAAFISEQVETHFGRCIM